MKDIKGKYYTTKEVAEKLGISADYARKLIQWGELIAERIGRNWIVKEKHLKKFKRLRFPKKKD